MQLKKLPTLDRIDATDEIQPVLSRYRKKVFRAGTMNISNYSSPKCTPSPLPTVGSSLTSIP